MTKKYSHKAIIRFDNKRALVLCGLGHVLEHHNIEKNYGGSALAAELANRSDNDRLERLAACCNGTGH